MKIVESGRSQPVPVPAGMVPSNWVSRRGSLTGPQVRTALKLMKDDPAMPVVNSATAPAPLRGRARTGHAARPHVAPRRVGSLPGQQALIPHPVIAQGGTGAARFEVDPRRGLSLLVTKSDRIPFTGVPPRGACRLHAEKKESVCG